MRIIIIIIIIGLKAYHTMQISSNIFDLISRRARHLTFGRSAASGAPKDSAWASARSFSS